MATPAPIVRCELSNCATTGIAVDCGLEVLGVGKPVVLSMPLGSRKTLIVFTLREDEARDRTETGELCGGTRRGI